jgi:short-subunit dehydrogenase
MRQGMTAMSLEGKTVVITGASSGIGRATAELFAKQGAGLVLAARRKALLDQVSAACEKEGAAAVAVEADVADPKAVDRIRDAALKRFGKIDVWINNAGTGAFGPYVDTPMELNRKTIETNLLGSMYGAHAVVPVFLKQGHGTLINNISMGGWAPSPFAAAYTASKFGLRGFTASLRQELAPHPGIHVCAVFPALVDTPGLNTLANFSGKTLNPGPFYYTPEDVAETFLSLVKTPRDEVAVGWPSRAAQIGYGLAPFLAERMMGIAMRWALSRANPGRNTSGSLLEPGPLDRGVSGGWLQRKQMPPASTLSKVGAATIVAALALTAVSQLRNPRRLGA